MKNTRIGLVLLTMALIACLCPALADPSDKLTQEELDRLAETEGLRFMHGFDWRSWVNRCKERGATDDMFVAAFSKVAERTMGAEYWTDDECKCMNAVASIREFSVAASNLTTVVQLVKNAKSSRVRSAAVSTYYKHTKGTDDYSCSDWSRYGNWFCHF